MGTILPPEYGIFRNKMNTTLRHDIQALYGPGPVRMYALFLRATLIPRYMQLPPPAIIYVLALGMWKFAIRVAGPRDKPFEAHKLLLRI